MAEELAFQEHLYIPPGEVQLLTNRVESLKDDHSVEFVISAENDCLKVTVKGRSASDVQFSKMKLLEKMYTSENARHDCIFTPAILQIVSNWTISDRLDLFDNLHCLATYIGDKNVGGIVKLSAWKQDDVIATKNRFKLFSDSSKESPKCERQVPLTKANSGTGDSFAATDVGPTSSREPEIAPISAQPMIPGMFHNVESNPPDFVQNGNGNPHNMYTSDNMGPFLQRHMSQHIVRPSGVNFVPSWHSNSDQHGFGFPDCGDTAKQFAKDCAAKLDSHSKCMNVLILGETGVGKSTFINSLINYLKYNSLDDAMSKGPDILIESDFTMYDHEFNAHKISLAPTVHSHNQKNENFGQGQSSTQDPKEYVFNWGKGNKMKAIRIIDTPGIGDTRGIDQDRKNFDKILSFISHELHAICILIKSNTARLTLAFRFCIDELLVHLHKSASENLLFCFTNTRGTLYKPSDALHVLSEHLGKLEVQRSIRIRLDISKLFLFDNESFRFLCAAKKGIKFTDADKSCFAASWTKSVKETHRLFDRIASMPVHKVSETLCLNNTRDMILALTRPLAEIARNQMVSVRLIQEKLKEIEECARKGEYLKGKLFVDQVKIVAEPLSRPRTVCTADSCVEYSHFEPNSNLPMQTVYKTVCHDGCGCGDPGVEVEICPNTKLQSCSALRQNINSCNVCGCPWSTHMHVKYDLKTENVKVQDEAVKRSLRNNDNMVDTINMFIASEKEKISQMEAEVKTITEYSAEFASFLSQNSIMPYNDSYRGYVEHLIREESEKVAAGGGTVILHKLQNYKSEYASQVALLEKSIGNNSGTVRTVEEINEKLKEIKQLRHAGSVLVDVHNVEVVQTTGP